MNEELDTRRWRHLRAVILCAVAGSAALSATPAGAASANRPAPRAEPALARAFAPRGGTGWAMVDTRNLLPVALGRKILSRQPPASYLFLGVEGVDLVTLNRRDNDRLKQYARWLARAFARTVGAGVEVTWVQVFVAERGKRHSATVRQLPPVAGVDAVVCAALVGGQVRWRSGSEEHRADPRHSVFLAARAARRVSTDAEVILRVGLRRLGPLAGR
jgi:hypothetical protein